MFRSTFIGLCSKAAGVASLSVREDPSTILTGKGRPFEMVHSEVTLVKDDIAKLVTKPDSEILNHAAQYACQGGGKLLRPSLVALMSYAVMDPATAAYFRSEKPLSNLDFQSECWDKSNLMCKILRLAEVTELIHTASLIHDDVIDDSSKRRGRDAVHVHLKSTKNAVLAGDFMLARASYWIATLEEKEVVINIAKALEDLTVGELLQDEGCFDYARYRKKSYCKTASLMDHSLSSAAIVVINHVLKTGGKFSESSKEIIKAAGAFGKHVGLAFQIVDDCLDITGDEKKLGKPKLGDMKEGVATLPVLLAAENDKKVEEAVRRKFSKEGDVEMCIKAMEAYETVPRALDMAAKECECAINELHTLHSSEARDSLESAASLILTRNL